MFVSIFQLVSETFSRIHADHTSHIEQRLAQELKTHFLCVEIMQLFCLLASHDSIKIVVV